MYLNPLVRGAFGLEADAPAGELTVAPHLFATPGVYDMTGVRVGRAVLDMRFDVRDTMLLVAVRRRSGDSPLALRFAPALAPGARLRDVTAGGRRVTAAVRDHRRDVHAVFTVGLAAGDPGTEVAVRHSRGWRIEALDRPLERGERSRHLKVLDARSDANGLQLEVEVRAGLRHEVRVIPPQGATRTEVFEVAADSGDPRDGYVRVTRRVRP
jgi:hypothetical protein